MKSRDSQVEKYLDAIMTKLDEYIARVPTKYREKVMKKLDRTMEVKYRSS